MWILFVLKDFSWRVTGLREVRSAAPFLNKLKFALARPQAMNGVQGGEIVFLLHWLATSSYFCGVSHSVIWNISAYLQSWCYPRNSQAYLSTKGHWLRFHPGLKSFLFCDRSTGRSFLGGIPPRRHQIARSVLTCLVTRIISTRQTALDQS